MPGNIEIIDHTLGDRPYNPPTCRVIGRSRGTFGVGFSLWNGRAMLEDEAVAEWSASHGDEAIYVMKGALLSDEGARCEAGGAIVVEAGVPLRLRAEGETEFMHFGAADPTPPKDGPLGPADASGHRARVVSWADARKFTIESGTGSVYKQSFYADGTSPTSRLALFNIHVNKVTHPSPHSHTQDEIIHVLSGDMFVGTVHIPAGSSVAVKANARYSFMTPGPLEFLNYRRDAAYIVVGNGENRRQSLETVDTKLKGDYGARPAKADA